MDSNRIYKDFKSLLSNSGFKFGTIKLESTKRVGDNIFMISEPISCLIYFKISSRKPCWWGVTENRVEELKQSDKKWFLILLCESAESGYFLNDEEVNLNMSNWSWSNGDFKVIPANIRPRRTFNSFEELQALLKMAS